MGLFLFGLGVAIFLLARWWGARAEAERERLEELRYPTLDSWRRDEVSQDVFADLSRMLLVEEYDSPARCRVVVSRLRRRDALAWDARRDDPDDDEPWQRIEDEDLVAVLEGAYARYLAQYREPTKPLLDRVALAIERRRE